MTALERTYELFSPAPGGGEKPLGAVEAALSEGAASELSDGGVIRRRQYAVALVRAENAPTGGFARGMTLCGGGKSWRVLSAAQNRRVWTLHLIRAATDGEA